MVDEVKVSKDEATPAVEAIVAPEVPAAAAAEPEQPIAEVPAKPVRDPKVKAKAVPVEAPAPVEAVVSAPAKPAKVRKPLKKAAAPTLAKARAPKLPVKAAAPEPAVKPASKRPFTAKPKVKTAPAKTQSVKTFVGSAKTPTSRKELFAMATTTEFTDKLQTAFKDAQEKAKAAFGDAGSFAKGNVEAIVESSKILASGLQDMTKGYVAETKTSFETMTADVKDLATVKSPTEFFEKQSALMRKNFDAAVAASSKNSEAMLKLVNEAFQPISTRVSLAVEKIKQAA